MRLVDLFHRWLGGVLGLLLAVMGTSGLLLVHADTLFRPATSASVSHIAPDAEIITAATTGTLVRPDYIILASGDFPFHQVNYADGSGRYLDRAGRTVGEWRNHWGRPELWLFDLHRYLLVGETGEAVVGIAALFGLAFVLSGTLLWWRRRRTFAFRLWPARLTRPALLRYHRDLGIMVAPLLVISFATGSMMALKPLGSLAVRPWSSPAEMKASATPPKGVGQKLALRPDWAGMLAEARRRYPDGEMRLVGFPRNDNGLILLRLRRPGEWLPNGYTRLWFAPGDGRLVETRDARVQPVGMSAQNAFYAFHAAKLGGLSFRLLMSLSGLGLALLGSLAVWSFWFKRPWQQRPQYPNRAQLRAETPFQS